MLVRVDLMLDRPACLADVGTMYHLEHTLFLGQGGAMNWKLTVLGALAYFVATWVVGFATAVVIHERILDPTYQATESFWRPELRQEPPDMGALMPRWIASGLLGSLIIAGIYGCVRSSFHGPGWRRGAIFGLCLACIQIAFFLGWSGIFALPDKVWIWWAIDGVIFLTVGGMALGWTAEKVAPA